MRFTIATPSYGNLEGLRKCVGSVKAQALSRDETGKLKPEVPDTTRQNISGLRSQPSGFSVTHIIQDGGSENWDSFRGKLNRLRPAGPHYAGQEPDTLKPEYQEQGTRNKEQRTRNYELQLHSEADGGMYDAINKAWGRGDGDVYCWLNSDEQYLPGTLEKVAGYFYDNPDVEAVFGDTIIIDPEGGPIAARPEIPLRRAYVVNGFCYALSCSCFYRRSLWDRGLLKLDATYRYAADGDLILRLLSSGIRFGKIDGYLALFTVSGSNLSFDKDGEMARESHEIKRRHGAFQSAALRKGVMAGRAAERLMKGCYRPVDLDYDFALDEVPNYRHVKAKGVTTRFSYEAHKEENSEKLKL